MFPTSNQVRVFHYSFIFFDVLLTETYHEWNINIEFDEYVGTDVLIAFSD